MKCCDLKKPTPSVGVEAFLRNHPTHGVCQKIKASVFRDAFLSTKIVCLQRIVFFGLKPVFKKRRYRIRFPLRGIGRRIRHPLFRTGLLCVYRNCWLAGQQKSRVGFFISGNGRQFWHRIELSAWVTLKKTYQKQARSGVWFQRKSK